VAGQDRLGYYVAQYDGEIAVADEQVGLLMDALRQSGRRERTVVVLTSDHGESLGEHGYYFDHGENLFDPSLRIPLVVSVPGGARRGVRSDALVSTLDLVPTILDALNVSYPPDLAGRSMLGVVKGTSTAGWDRVFARSDRNLTASLDRRYKVVATPQGEALRYALFDREADRGETRDLARRQPDLLRAQRKELDLFFQRGEREWRRTQALAGDERPPVALTRADCDALAALGYLDAAKQCAAALVPK
jgi:arylsulfatase A-like enzyme